MEEEAETWCILGGSTSTEDDDRRGAGHPPLTGVGWLKTGRGGGFAGRVWILGRVLGWAGIGLGWAGFWLGWAAGAAQSGLFIFFLFFINF